MDDITLNGVKCVPVEGIVEEVVEVNKSMEVNPQDQVGKGIKVAKKTEFTEKYGFEQSAFFRIIEELLQSRNSFEPGTYNNLVYKFICNAGIGAMGRGLSHKMVYDPGTESSVPVPAGPLTNPLYAG